MPTLGSANPKMHVDVAVAAEIITCVSGSDSKKRVTSIAAAWVAVPVKCSAGSCPLLRMGFVASPEL